MPLNYDNEELSISEELSQDPYSEEPQSQKTRKSHKKDRYTEQIRENTFYD